MAFSSYLGLGQLVVPGFHDVLEVGHELGKLHTRHVHDAAGILGVHSGTQGLLVFVLELDSHIEGAGSVGVEFLQIVQFKLDSLELVAVGRVLVLLELVVHESKTFHDGLAFAVSLGLRRRRRRASVGSAAEGGGHGCITRSHCASECKQQRAGEHRGRSKRLMPERGGGGAGKTPMVGVGVEFARKRLALVKTDDSAKGSQGQ